ncbi:hypothetical protein [Frondihabitans sp. PAMC 28766]|uniref:hypothetical protein n=1 Tax=Frondihabitans sp. PAMC 28766 TaxID=1795630 RepID=UPI0012FF8C1B|nr:hypothetical protein [Frondihabitans sp. PAMC 28766]
MSEVVAQGDLPLWAYESGRMHGHVETTNIELSSDLRIRLDRWNVECVDSEDEHGFRGPDWPLHLVTRSFELAAELQLEIGDESVVWCAGGGGLGTLEAQYLEDPGDSIVLVAPSGLGAVGDVIQWEKRADYTIGSSLLRFEDLPLSPSVSLAATAWSNSIGRVIDHPGAMGVPAGGRVRALGARLAGTIQEELGRQAHVFYFGGGAPMPSWSGSFADLRSS